MIHDIHRLWLITASLLLMSCASDSPPAQAEAVLARPWAEIEEAVRGQTVNWMMWQGDPLINAYVQDFVAPSLKATYDITLRVASGQGNVIVSTLMTELEAGRVTMRPPKRKSCHEPSWNPPQNT